MATEEFPNVHTYKLNESSKSGGGHMDDVLSSNPNDPWSISTLERIKANLEAGKSGKFDDPNCISQKTRKKLRNSEIAIANKKDELKAKKPE